MLRLRSMLRFLKNHPHVGVVLAVLGLGLAGVLAPNIAHAADALGNAIVTVLSWILTVVVSILGVLLVKFIDVLIWVFQFNNFINAPAVQTGWSVTRDIANMIFIIVLLVIAIATVFRIQEYKTSRMLQKVILMAILINFSKLICGFFIDLSQVVMLTFVNAFKDMAAGNLTTGFGLHKVVTLSQTASAATDINYWSIVGAMFAAVVMLFIALIVVGVFVVVLIQRIVMLWIYIVLAPTAYMVYALPPGFNSWWSSWWRDFSQLLIKGPVIAFFMWLSLTIISLTNNVLFVDTTQNTPADVSASFTSTTGGTDLSATASDATTSEAIIAYILAVGMLIAGLQQATKVGGAAGAVAGKWMGNLNKWGGAAATGAVGAATFLPRLVGRNLGGGMVKRAAYNAADLGLAVGSRIPGIKGYMGQQRGKLRNLRDSKATPDLERMDYNTLKAKVGMQLTESGDADRKAAAPVIMRKKEFANESPAFRQKVWNVFKKSKGYKQVYKDGKVSQEYESQRARGEFNEMMAKNPALWSIQMQEVEAGFKSGKMGKPEYDARMAHLDGKVRTQVNKLTTAQLNDMSTKTITSGRPEDQRFNQVFTEELITRLNTNDNFKRNFFSNVKADQINDFEKGHENLLTATGADGSRLWAEGSKFRTFPTSTKSRREDTDEMLSAQQDIDVERQQDTAARVAAYQARNLNFHESDEYLENPGQFYDQQSYQANVAQQQRGVVRDNLRESGTMLPVTGTASFGNRDTNNLGVGNDILEKAGVKLTAGGTVIDPEQKKKVAAAVSSKLVDDIQAIENTLATVPAAQLDHVPEGSSTSVRKQLEMQKANLERTWERIDDPSKLDGISFINQDREGGKARNILAEEAYHRKLNTMDADGSFRDQLRQSMSPQELQKITADMRAIPGQENLDEKRAFEEYLAKGLTNLSRETWADTSPSAVKLDQKLALPILAQAEKTGVRMKLDLLQEQANVQVPGRFATVGAGTRAVARGAKEFTKGAASSAKEFAKGTAVSALDYTKGKVQQGKEVAAMPYRAVKGALGQRAAGKEEQKLAEIPTGQLGVKVTKDGLQAKRQELAAFEKQTQQESDELTRQYQEQENTMGTVTNPLVARRSAQKMKELRKNIQAKAKALTEKRAGVTDYEVMLKNSQESLGENVGGAFRKGTLADQRMAASRGERPQTATPSAPAPAPVPQPSAPATPRVAATPAPKPAPAPSAPGSATPQPPASTAQAEAEESNVLPGDMGAGQPPVVNITNNISQVYRSAPENIRANLSGINAQTLDSALRNSIVWRGLMSYIKNNAQELQKSDKLGALGRQELQKRMGTMEKHMNEGNAQAFKDEFNSLQGIFNSSGDSES